MTSLGADLPRELNRVRKLQREYVVLLGVTSAPLEPQIARMEEALEAGFEALATADIVAMIHVFHALKACKE